MKQIIALIFLLISPSICYADSWKPSHSCRKPYKPFNFNNQWDVDQYNDDVRRFKRCIEDFIKEQETEAQNHMDAANQAIEDWNNFIRWN